MSVSAAATASNRPRLPATARRGRMVRSATARGGSRQTASSVIMGSSSSLTASHHHRPMVPAQYVPEDLIGQAQVVLQGKSRNLIIRELQRTNLDVNLAVNNLLSRDDEESEDMDDSQDSYLPSDDLMSLLDAGIHNDHPSVIIDSDAVFPEDVFNYSAVRVRSSGAGISASRLSTSRSDRDRDSSAPEREHMIRFGERGTTTSSQYISTSGSGGGTTSRRWLEYALRDSASASDGSKSPGVGGGGPCGLDTGSSSTTAASRKRDSCQLNPLFVSEQLEWWSTEARKFVGIMGLYSELVAVSVTGQLHQWRWSDSEPFRATLADGQVVYHPRVVSLGLQNEKISMIAGNCARASVLTESNKIASWMDETISIVASKLEHAAQGFDSHQFQSSGSSSLQMMSMGEKVLSLHVCSLYTSVRLDSGSIFWWGIAPANHRKKVWEKTRSKAKKNNNTRLGASNSNAGNSEIVVGAQVCMRNSPSYHPGAIGFTTAGGVPKVGQLLTAAWSLSDTCAFKLLSVSELKKMGYTTPYPPTTNQVTSGGSSSQSGSKSSSSASAGMDLSLLPTLTKLPIAESLYQPPSPASGKTPQQERLEMPPPPSPASSTCSEPGTGSVTKRSKRTCITPSSLKEDEKKDEEMWPLKDVVFLEDVKNLPVGKVIKIDGNYVAVKFNSPPKSGLQSGDPANSADISQLLDDCRLMRKEDLQVVKGSFGKMTPDCFQRLPRKVAIPDSAAISILTLSVSNQGIHAIIKNKNKLSYVIYSVTSGKIEQVSLLSLNVA